MDTYKEIIYYDQRNAVLDNFTLNSYREAIKEIYRYNEKTNIQINQILIIMKKKPKKFFRDA